MDRQYVGCLEMSRAGATVAYAHHRLARSTWASKSLERSTPVTNIEDCLARRHSSMPVDVVVDRGLISSPGVQSVSSLRWREQRVGHYQPQQCLVPAKQL